MRVRPAALACLLCASGCCALVYQVAWLRLLRLVFGTSTAASAAVLAIFLGGLGLGGLLLGRRADAARNAVRLYAALELGVALAAAASPLLIALARSLYLWVGGTTTLGAGAGSLVRLVLSAVVLGVPTFLMGGTLPAAVRAVERASDVARRDMGLLYAANTLGAVSGSLYASFFALEAFGTNLTIWSASVLNILVAVAAGVLASSEVAQPATPPHAASDPPAPSAPAADPAPLVLAAAAVVGAAFLLMELVWYRVLGPLLGGSSYTFGLILSVALLGIGAGGLLYAVGPRPRRPTLLAFAATCMLEALCIVLPYAAGDRLALLTIVLRPFGNVGFLPSVLMWVLITLLVVFPAAVVAGYQFPLLVGLLGAGSRHVGREVGLAYAWNTAGAIAGALAAGFGLMPLLTATGVWKGVVVMLVGLGAATIRSAVGRGSWPWRATAPALIGVAAACLCLWEGPTALWRHSGAGAGRFNLSLQAPNDWPRMRHDAQRMIAWDTDGIESTVALEQRDGYSFIVNGKNDGNAVGDAPTQVMSGLIGALFHPNLKRVLVIGLGTGSTAGWLAQIPSVERVDIIELEPAVTRVAEACSQVNHHVLANPKVRLIIGDGRELLLTTTDSYDLVFSEPSNPYRAGVASLFTREFYAAVSRRLNDDGVLVQWLPAYEVEAQTLRTVYATVSAVFPSVETWEVKAFDLVLVARRQRHAHDLALLRSRVEEEPYRSALALVWGVAGVEGLYSGFVANADLPAALSRTGPQELNTDDRTLIEYQFARSVGRSDLHAGNDLRAFAVTKGYGQPPVGGAALDGLRVAELNTVRAAADGRTASPSGGARDPALVQRLLARRAYTSGDLRAALTYWNAQSEGPQGPMDLTMLAEVYAAAADARALDYVERLRAVQPAEAEAILALWYANQRQPDTAVEHLAAAFRAYRDHPWSHRFVFKRSFDLAWNLSVQRPDLSGRLYEALAEPFAARALEEQRRIMYVNLGNQSDFAAHCVAAMETLEPYVPWDGHFLEERVRCYQSHNHPRAAQAQADLQAFLANAPSALEPPATH
jgi:spermidine synthase